MQGIIDATTFIIRCDKSKKIVKVQLDGVRRLEGNPNLKEIIDLQNKITDYTLKNFNQRNVFIDLTDYDEVNNNFIGVIWMQGKGKQKMTIQ